MAGHILRIGVKVAQQTLTLSVLVRIQYPQPCVHRRHITNKFRPVNCNYSIQIEENENLEFELSKLGFLYRPRRMVEQVSVADYGNYYGSMGLAFLWRNSEVVTRGAANA